MKRIIFVGHFRGPSGYGNAARSYLKCLDTYLQKNPNLFELKIYTWRIETTILTDQELKLIEKYEFKDDNELANFCEQKYETVFFLAPSPSIINRTGFDVIMNKSVKNTNIVVWETQKVPDLWMDSYKKYFKQILVPCEWNKQVFESQTGLKTFKVPYMLEFTNEPVQRNRKNIFNIVSMSQWTKRKGFDILIKAYCSEFYHHEDVLLTIKTYGHAASTGRFEEDKNSIINDIKTYKAGIIDYNNLMKCKINIITGVLGKQEINKIYDNSDIFCLPTRGEGFGLTIAEAISRNMPVIVPNKGGHLDYIHKNNFFVESRFITSTDVYSSDYSSIDMKLVETDLDDLRSQFRKAYQLWKENPEQLLQIGLESRKFLQEYCNPQDITNNLVNVIIN